MVKVYDITTQAEFDSFLSALKSHVGNKAEEGILVRFKVGSYLVSEPIDLPSNITFRGNGATLLFHSETIEWGDKGVLNAVGTVEKPLTNIAVRGIIVKQVPVEEGKQKPKVRGINFIYVNNSFVDECLTVDFRLQGIYLSSSSNNNTITGNTCTGNSSSGIYLGNSSNNNTVTSNTCNGNSSSGIYLGSSSNNTVTGNTCTGNSSFGIYLYGSNNNTITGNTCSGNSSSGIYLGNSSNNNTVTSNTVTGNTSYGIYLSISSNNTVTGNTCSGNSFGIYLSSNSNNNLIYSCVTLDNVSGDFKNDGTGNQLETQYNQFLGKVEA